MPEQQQTNDQELFHTALTESVLSFANNKNNNNNNNDMYSGKSNVIIHGEAEESGEWSYIDIETPLQNSFEENDMYKQTKIEISAFIRNIRAVLNPLQLALFIDIFNAISQSSQLIAKTIQQNGHNHHNENLNLNLNHHNKPILDFQLKIHKTILILLQNNNDIIPSDWYLNASNDDDIINEQDKCTDNGNETYLSLIASYPWIRELLIAQIGIKLRNIGLHFQQIPSQSICTINISSIKMVEFLPINCYSTQCMKQFGSKPKPRQMILRQILTIHNKNKHKHKNNNDLENWKPQIIISIRNVSNKRSDINIEIQPNKIDLDFELFARLNQISKAFTFIARSTHTDTDNDGEEKTEHTMTQTIKIKTWSICIRFSVNDDHNMPRKENILFEFDELIATNETSVTTKREAKGCDVWHLDCKNLNVLLAYENKKHLLLKSYDNNSLKIQINNNKHYEEEEKEDDDDTVDISHLEQPHFRWWEQTDNTKSKQIKFPIGDKKATTHKFELSAQRLSPMHIHIILPKATVACSKSQYDLLIEFYMKAIDSLQQIEARSYAPLYAPHRASSMNLADMPSFAAKIMQKEDEIISQSNSMSLLTAEDKISPFISSVKIIILQGRIDINEDYDKNIQEIEIMDHTVSSLQAQTFRLDFKSLQVTHIVKTQKHNCQSKVSYVILRTNDLCLLEFDEVLQPFTDNVSQQYLSLHNNNNNNNNNMADICGKASPLLFKTLETQTFGTNAVFDSDKEDESDVLHLFLSLRVNKMSGNDEEEVEYNHNNNNNTFLQIFTLVNLRALSHEFRLNSEWSTKLSEFFSVDIDIGDIINNNNKKALQNITNVYVNAYDCCISYNPVAVDERLVITSEKIRISTNIVALSPMVSVSIECCDGAVYLHPDSLKTFSKSLLQLLAHPDNEYSYELRAPYLHRLPGNLLADHLDSIGFVGILDFDWMEAFISQNKQMTKNDISITGGCIKIKTCKDSTASLLSIIKYFIDQIITQPTIEEVELLITEPQLSPTQLSQANAPIIDSPLTVIDTSKIKRFNILGNIDQHMFVNVDDDNIGIDDEDDDDGHECIEFITDYARTQSQESVAKSPNREYVDLQEEREKCEEKVNKENEQSSVWYKDKYVDVNYLDKKLREKFDGLTTDPNLPQHYPLPITHIKITDLSLYWKIFAGLDFNQKHKSKQEEVKHEFFEHEYANINIAENTQKDVNYKSNRRVDEVMQMCLNNISFSFYQFNQFEYIANRLVLAIKNIEMLDLIHQSNFHKFLCFYRQKQEMQIKNHETITKKPNMLTLEMNSMRPEAKKDPDRLECTISIALAPLRLNIDQLAIDFLIKFFSFEHQQEEKEEDAAEAADIYFESFIFSELVICVDYNPRRVDFDRLRAGDYSQFVHLFPLSLVEIRLQSFEIAGCQGWDNCFVELAKFWANDFATHQTHKYVAGIQPVRSLVNMGSGIADLVIIPIQQYKYDGRIGKGLQKGAKSAVQKITLETLDLSDGLFTTVHSFLSSLESLFHSKSRRMRRKLNYLGRSHALYEPHNTSEGLRQASESFTKGIINAAHSIAFIPMEKYKSSGMKAGFKSVLKGVPSAILHPLIGTTKAVSNAIVGVRNAIDNDNDDEDDDEDQHLDEHHDLQPNKKKD